MRTGAKPIRPTTSLLLAFMVLHVFNAANVRLGVPRQASTIRSIPVGPELSKSIASSRETAVSDQLSAVSPKQSALSRLLLLSTGKSESTGTSPSECYTSKMIGRCGRLVYWWLVCGRIMLLRGE